MPTLPATPDRGEHPATADEQDRGDGATDVALLQGPGAAPRRPSRTGRQRLQDRAAVRRLVPDVVFAVVLVAVGLAPIGWELESPGPLVLALAACSIVVRRVRPGIALTLAWGTALLQIGLYERPSIVQIATLAVLYSAAAHGRRPALLASAGSVVAGGVIATPYLAATGARFTYYFSSGSPEQQVLVALLPTALLGSAWLAGFAVRASRSRRVEAVHRSAAEDRATEAQETADVERFRSVMAREVHDVVGHSLAVIIAQADAAEVVDDPARVRGMVADIARTARSSLDEVRAVLERTGADDAADPGDLDEVLARVRATGAPLEDERTGAPVDLPPSVALVARRVLQEMLTNALRHGASGGVIRVERRWRPTALIIRTSNEEGPRRHAGSGRGLAGMRSRVHAIGGTLETDVVDGRFVVRARIPLRSETHG